MYNVIYGIGNIVQPTVPLHCTRVEEFARKMGGAGNKIGYVSRFNRVLYEMYDIIRKLLKIVAVRRLLPRNGAFVLFLD